MFARDDVCRDHRPLPHEGIATCQLHEEDDRVRENDDGRDGRKSLGAESRPTAESCRTISIPSGASELGQQLELLMLCLISSVHVVSRISSSLARSAAISSSAFALTS